MHAHNHVFETVECDLLRARQCAQLGSSALFGKRKRAGESENKQARGGNTWWWWDNGSIWRFSKGRDDAPVGDWQELGNDETIQLICGLSTGLLIEKKTWRALPSLGIPNLFWQW